MVLNPCDYIRHVQSSMTFPHLEKIKQKMPLLIHSFIQQKLQSSALMELKIWGETGNDKVITQMNVKSQRSGKDDIRAHVRTVI